MMVLPRRDQLIVRYRNAGLIFNSCAGALRHDERRIERALSVLRAAGHSVEAWPTTGPGTAGRIARGLIERGADLILVAGGDGTINETLDGMAEAAVPLGVLPAGTANVLGHEIGLDGNLEQVAARIGELEPVRVALGRLSLPNARPRHFLTMAGIGLDARVVTEVDPDLKRRLGKVAYWIAAFRLLGRQLAEFDVRAGDVTRRCGFALAARVRNYGGDLEIARGASLLRRDFELVLFEGAAVSAYLKYFAGVATGTLRRMDGATVFTARSLELAPVKGASVPLQVDGEFAGYLPATIEIVEDALTLLAPPEYLARERRLNASNSGTEYSFPNSEIGE